MYVHVHVYVNGACVGDMGCVHYKQVFTDTFTI